MKRLIFGITAALLTVSLLAAGCATQPEAEQTPPATQQPATTPPAKQPSQPSLPEELASFEGVITEIGPNTVTVVSAKGEARTFNLTPDSKLLLEGDSCSLDELEAAQNLGIVGLDCTVVYDVNEAGEAIIVDASFPPEEQDLASVSGVIQDINEGRNTITILTDEGDTRVFDITSDSKLLLGGGSCSIDELLSAEALGVDLGCTVIYDVNNEGEAIIIDVGPTP